MMWRRIKRVLYFIRFLPLAQMRGTEIVGRIEVSGRAQFRYAIQDALTRLQRVSPDAWGRLQQDVGDVFEGGRSFIMVTSRRPMCSIRSAAIANRNHLAGILAHMACNRQVFLDYVAEHPNSAVPRSAYAGKDVNLICNVAYNDCVRKLTAIAEYMAPDDGTQLENQDFNPSDI